MDQPSSTPLPIALPARLGIDLGGTKIEAVVMQADGSISHRQRCPTPDGDYEGTIRTLVELTQAIATDANLHLNTPIGIGTPGAVSLKSGLMMNCNSTCLNGQPLAKDLARASGRQVRIANDADCFALSEASDGAAADASWMMGLILGTGVGSGIVINQRLSQGVNAIRGEWGHNSLPIQALQHELRAELRDYKHQCFCGRTDCVETWLAGPAFENHYVLMGGEHLRADEIMARVRGGELLAANLFKCHLHLLALALANLINILDPEVIVLGGGLSNISELYSQLPTILPDYVFSDVLNTRIKQAMHGDSSGVRGAAWLWQTLEVQKLIAGES